MAKEKQRETLKIKQIMSFSGGEQVFSISSKERGHNKLKKTKQTKKKQPPPPRKKKKKTKKSFSIISLLFSLFGGCPEFPFFDNLAKKRAPQKNYKIGVSAKHCLKKRDMRHETTIFG